MYLKIILFLYQVSNFNLKYLKLNKPSKNGQVWMLVMTSALSSGQWPEAPPSTAFNLNMTRLCMRRAPLSLQWEGEREERVWVCEPNRQTVISTHPHVPSLSLSHTLTRARSFASRVSSLMVPKGLFCIELSLKMISKRRSTR